MLNVLITGKLARDPINRTSKNGNPYTTASVSVPTDENWMLASVIVFDATEAAALSRLRAGDDIAVSGSAKLSSWEKDGQTRYGLSVVGSRILSVYDIRQRRRQQADSQQATQAPGAQSQSARQASGEPFNDSIPF